MPSDQGTSSAISGTRYDEAIGTLQLRTGIGPVRRQAFRRSPLLTLPTAPTNVTRQDTLRFFAPSITPHFVAGAAANPPARSLRGPFANIVDPVAQFPVVPACRANFAVVLHHTPLSIERGVPAVSGAAVGCPGEGVRPPFSLIGTKETAP